MAAPLMLHEAAAIAAQTSDVMRLRTRRGRAEPDTLLLLCQLQAARMGECSQAVQIRGRRRPRLPGDGCFHNGNLLTAWAGATTTRPPDPVRGDQSTLRV